MMQVPAMRGVHRPKIMSASSAQPLTGNPAAAPALAGTSRGGVRTPLCFVVDSDASIRHFLSLILHGAGIDTEEFADGQSLFGGAEPAHARCWSSSTSRWNPPKRSALVVALGKRGYSGYVQLMSNRGSAVLAHVKSIGDQHRLQMLPVLKKPFETGAIVENPAGSQARAIRRRSPAASISTRR